MTPPQLQAAYGLTAAAGGGSGRTVAVIESGDDPSVEQDLAVFRSDNNLSSCTTANGCFRKVAQDGSISYPVEDLGWGVEADIDTQTVSAICPNCHILLVEANEVSGVAQFSNLAAAVNTAVSLGAFAVSNSYTTGESASLLQYASSFSHPGVTITAASGDGSTLAPQMPADFSTVIAVGGTKLSQASNARGWTETVWGAAGGAGCSAIIAKPVWQTDTGCSMRTVADISFWTDSWDALPQSTFQVYVGLPPSGGSAYWAQVVGTSFGAPAIAAMYALANVSAQNASGFYASPNGLTDITSGSTAQLDTSTGLCMLPVASGGGIGIADSSRRTNSAPSELPAYYCNGEIGYDAPTGNGSPYGISSFVPVGATPVPIPTASSCPSTSVNPNPHPTENPNGTIGCGTS